MCSWIKKSVLLEAGIVALIGIALLSMPVLAYLYRSNFVVTNNSTTQSYTYLPVWVASNNTYMANNGFMRSDGLDAQVTTQGGTIYSTLIAHNKTLAVIPSVGTQSNTNLYFVTGNPVLSSMPIVTGYGGYITTADNVTEPSANWSIDWSGYVSPTSIATANVSTEQTLLDSDGTLYTGSWTRLGQRISVTGGSTISDIGFQLRKGGTPPDNLFITVRKVSDDSIIQGIALTKVADNITGVYTWYYSDTPIFVADSQEVRLLVEYPYGGIANYVQAGYYAAANVAEGVLTRYNGAYTDSAAQEATIRYSIASPPTFVWKGADLFAGFTSSGNLSVSTSNSSLNVTGLTDAITTLSVINDSTSLRFRLNGGAWNTTTSGNVLNNVSSWVWLKNLPYTNYLKLYVGGNLILWYQPTSIIQGSTMPDRSSDGVDNAGVITWGTNPIGVSVSLSEMISSSQPAPVNLAETPPKDVLPEVPVSDWYKNPDIGGTLATNPLRPFVTIVSDNSSMTELQAWRFLGLIVILFVAVASAKILRGHLGLASIATGVAIGGIVAWTIWPMWALVFAIGCFLGGLILERTPSY